MTYYDWLRCMSGRMSRPISMPGFPKYDHVVVGTGTMQQNQSLIKGLHKGPRACQQTAVPGRSDQGGSPPDSSTPVRVGWSAARRLWAAAGVTKSSGEGIYFAAKSGRMCAEAIVEISNSGASIPTEKQIKSTYLKRWDRKYGATYVVLDILQRIFYRNDAAREAFVEMCDDKDVQKLTFDSYLYKRVVNPWQQIKLTLGTLGSLIRGGLSLLPFTTLFPPPLAVPTAIFWPRKRPSRSKPKPPKRRRPSRRKRPASLRQAGPQDPDRHNCDSIALPAVSLIRSIPCSRFLAGMFLGQRPNVDGINGGGCQDYRRNDGSQTIAPWRMTTDWGEFVSDQALRLYGLALA